MKDYASIISKDNKKMVEEVKNILKEKQKIRKVDLLKIQEKRIKELERVFNGDDINA